MSIKVAQVIFVVIVVKALVSPIHPCKDHVIDEIYERMNSYKGNQLFIPGARLCENSMIIECKDNELSKVDLVDLTFSGVLPLKRRFLADGQKVRSLRTKRGDPVDGDPDVPARTTVETDARPPKYPLSKFTIEGTIEFTRKGNPQKYQEKFSTSRRGVEFELQVTCLDESLDKLENIYVSMNSNSWDTTFSGCTDDRCSDVQNIVKTKITNSFTVALKKLVERLGVTGQPDLATGPSSSL